MTSLHISLAALPTFESSVVSVVVCTYNRRPLLERCLNSLIQQHGDVLPFEVLVVDNGSNDGTAEFLSSFCCGRPEFRCIVEKTVGLSHARNRGCQEARGDYLAYLDDDAEASAGWIAEIFSFISRNPEAVMFGGPYVAYTTVKVPDWFPPEYGSMNHGPDERVLDIGREFIEGLNMVIRKDALLAAGGFHPDLGMRGTTVSYGEETQLQIIFHRQGHDIYYLPRLIVRHHLPERKMHLSWLLRGAFAVGRCSRLTRIVPRSFFSHLAGIAYGIVTFFKVMLCRKGIPFKRKAFYALTTVVSELGALLEFLSEKKNMKEVT